MLDEVINPTLIEQTLQDKDATQLELELAYRLRDAIEELDRLCQEVSELRMHDEWQDPAPGEN